MDREQVKALKANMHATFDSSHGKEVMRYMEAIGGWYPNAEDSMETNYIVGRDACRRLIGTLKTILVCSPDEIATAMEQ